MGSLSHRNGSPLLYLYLSSSPAAGQDIGGLPSTTSRKTASYWQQGSVAIHLSINSTPDVSPRVKKTDGGLKTHETAVLCVSHLDMPFWTFTASEIGYPQKWSTSGVMSGASADQPLRHSKSTKVRIILLDFLMSCGHS